MTAECTEAQWLHDHAEVSWDELVNLSGIPAELLRELVEYGALNPVNAQARAEVQVTQWQFAARCVVVVRTVARLREDFDLDASALPLALKLIERIHGFEPQLQALQSQIPGPHSG